MRRPIGDGLGGPPRHHVVPALQRGVTGREVRGDGETTETILLDLPSLGAEDGRASLHSPRLVRARTRRQIAALGFDVDTVLEGALGGRSDADVWNAKRRRSLPRDPGSRLPGRPQVRVRSHHGILVVRLPDSERWRIGDDLVAWLSPDVAHVEGLLYRRHAQRSPCAAACRVALVSA